MIPIRDNIQKFGTDPILEDQIRIYETKKSILDRPSRPVAQRIEAVSLFGSRWALSEDSGFKSYPSRPEVYLVKNVVEGSNYWGYGYKTQHFLSEVAVNHLKKARGNLTET